MSHHTPQLHPEDYRALKTATRVLVQHLGGLDAAASIARPGRSQFGEYADPHKPERWLPLDAIADAERAAGRPIVTQVLARMNRHMLVPMPDAAAGPFARDVGDALTAATEAARALMQALADGTITPAERAEVAAHLHETIRLAHLGLMHAEPAAEASAPSAAERLRAVAGR